MRLPQIRMESTFMKIGIQTEAAYLTMKQPKPIQRIEQPKAIITMETKPGKLTIDQSQAFAEVNRKPTRQLFKEFGEEGKKKLLEGIARRAGQGRELMEIEKGGNPLPSQAMENSQEPSKRLGITWIPSHGSVKIQYEPAKVNIEVIPQKPIHEFEPQKPEIQYSRGKVNIYIAQKNSLKIWFESRVDEKI